MFPNGEQQLPLSLNLFCFYLLAMSPIFPQSPYEAILYFRLVFQFGKKLKECVCRCWGFLTYLPDN